MHFSLAPAQNTNCPKVFLSTLSSESALVENLYSRSSALSAPVLKCCNAKGPQGDVGRSRSQLWTPFTILWTPFTIWQKLWTAPPKFPEKSRFFRNISNTIILWKNVSSEPNSVLDLNFSHFKAFWVEAHERFQRLRVFHAQPLSSFSRKSFNESPLGAGPNSYSTKS